MWLKLHQSSSSSTPLPAPPMSAERRGCSALARPQWAASTPPAVRSLRSHHKCSCIAGMELVLAGLLLVRWTRDLRGVVPCGGTTERNSLRQPCKPYVVVGDARPQRQTVVRIGWAIADRLRPELVAVQVLGDYAHGTHRRSTKRPGRCRPRARDQAVAAAPSGG